MRPGWSPSISFTALILVAACGMDAGTLPSRPDVAPQESLSPGRSRLHEYTIGVRRNGKLKRFRVRVDKDEQTLTITGISDPAECDPEIIECTYNGFPVDEPLDGGRIIIGSVTATDPLPVAECPPVFSGGAWVGWRHHNFIIWGTWQRLMSRQSWPFGKAEYRIPAGPWESDDGNAIIYSGVVLGSCYGGYSREGWEGVISFSWLRGDAREDPDSNDSGGGGWGDSAPPDAGDGATTIDTSNGETTETSGNWYTGDPEVDKVLKAFYESGDCTAGWVIYVDDVQVC